MKQWQIWIDRGGTFTDIVVKKPDGSLMVFLSPNDIFTIKPSVAVMER